MAPTNNYDDEALARALQIEYEREYRRRSMQQHLNVSGTTANTNRNTIPSDNGTINTTASLPPHPTVVPSAPLAENYYDNGDDDDHPIYNSVGSHRGIASTQQSVPRTSFVTTEDAFGGVEMSDATYASQLQRQSLIEERRRNERKQHLQQQRDSYRIASGSMNRGTNSVTKVAVSTNMVPNCRITSTTPFHHHLRMQTSIINLYHHFLIDRLCLLNYFPFTQDFSSKEHPSRNNSVSASYSSSKHSREAFVQPTGNNFINQSRGSEKGHSIRNNRSNDMSGFATAVTGTSTLYSDEELARRLEQEMRDEELARQAFIEEQIRQSSIAAQSMSETNRRSARTGGRSSCRRCLSCLLMLALVGAAAALLLYFFVGADDVGDFIPNPDQFRQEDPFNSANKEDANLWRTKGNVGLELVVVNALDDEWNPYFTTAVNQWDNGTPDTLALATEDASPDSTCNAIDGKLKVCNGNYGATNWRGINKILLENGWIFSSAARMNEYYVTDNDDAQRQYTMCHEVRFDSSCMFVVVNNMQTSNLLITLCSC
jgi:hypothetical protein